MLFVVEAVEVLESGHPQIVNQMGQEEVGVAVVVGAPEMRADVEELAELEPLVLLKHLIAYQ